MKPILALNAFDMRAAAAGGALEGLLRQRAQVFGSASVLFYEQPLQFVRGQGCWLYDAQGVAYLDAYNNVPSVGHCHPRVVEAATRQLGQLNGSGHHRVRAGFAGDGPGRPLEYHLYLHRQ
jgi:4-aminobutyrate aminotransferase-like enzyme